MDTYTESLNWSCASQSATDPVPFVKTPGLDHVDAPALSQLLTPPCSVISPISSPLSHAQEDSFENSASDNFPAEIDGDIIVPVSTTFFPGADILTFPPDIIILSSDSVFFYVHSSVLLAASFNAFNGITSISPNQDCDATEPVVLVAEHSSILNIILHSIYDMSCSHYAPSFESLSSAVAAFPKYGLSAKKLVAHSTSLYHLLLSHAPLHPLEVYALAAKYDVYDLAVPTSSHLLSFPLASISDEMADIIGSKYLRQLFFLHLGRMDALKRLLLPPPPLHPSMESCSFEDQKQVTRAWALASAYLAWDAQPDVSMSAMQSALGPLKEQLGCGMCRESLRVRLNHVIVQWSVIKRTI
ncbi:hypothetical protein CONPUDRAFT_165966 [Coniophora puteana RWD-64-598 SS2]|uniref:BTB domain-containing protein n=1 Tax=Coniophora puteana (strain RWD-64-598) TaxID=741705 RepID=A0A5M3MN17_CONPW|nr:uncharacterized protein CONPUDRAFT_165966 [Coniophora puteana RWD-64-598 SS2]EIW80447.1 hypothetical protein CONPUDRAFT_165966 [Coniophora puteana RWD-64-598 SS2]